MTMEETRHRRGMVSSNEAAASAGHTKGNVDTPEEEEVLVDDEAIHFREEHYQELRHTMGVSSTEEGDTSPPGLPPDALTAIQDLWTPLSRPLLENHEPNHGGGGVHGRNHGTGT